MAVSSVRSWFRLLCLGVCLFPGIAGAVELSSGDVVLFSDSPCGIYRLDPVTLAPTAISDCLGFGSEAHHLTVNRSGRLLVTDEVRGVVEVSPFTGARTVVAPVEALGGPPRGIAHEADGQILVSVQSSPPRVYRIDPETGMLAVVTEGGLLVGPAGIDVAPDGAIFVADQSSQTSNPVPGRTSMGALVKVDPVTGVQTLIAADPLFQSPQAVAFGGDSVWIVSRGFTLRSVGGAITVTRLSDGMTTYAPVGSLDSQGIANLSGGRVVYSACNPVSGDCFYPFVAVYPGGASLSGYMGTLTVVPEQVSPVTTVLGPVVPNPFVSSTSVNFSLTRSGTAELAVFTVNGRRIVTLAQGHMSAGPHSVFWNARDGNGKLVPAGLYFARLRTTEGQSTRALVLIR